VAHIGVNSLRTRSAILRLSSSTRPIRQHHRVVIMEPAAISRASWSLQVRKKGPSGKQGINLTDPRSDPCKQILASREIGDDF
jgi:hypothetical protein